MRGLNYETGASVLLSAMNQMKPQPDLDADRNTTFSVDLRAFGLYVTRLYHGR